MTLIDGNSCLVIVKISGIITVIFIIAIIAISFIFTYEAEKEYHNNQTRLTYNHNISMTCATVLNITNLECDYICSEIFGRANQTMIDSYCVKLLLDHKNDDLRFIPKCVDLFTGTGLPAINGGSIDTYGNYITGKSMRTVMLPISVLGLILHIVIYYCVKTRNRAINFRSSI